MKKKKMIISILLVCLLCVHALGTVVKAEDGQPTQYLASSGYEFRNVLSLARDGDIIIITDVINLTGNIQIGSDTKHLTVKRSAAYSRITMAYGCTMTVKNVTFDGNGIDSVHSMIQTSAYATFDNCTFMNCGNRENFSSSGSTGGAVNVQSCSCVFNDCYFEENFSMIGGSVAVSGDSQVEINRCTIKNNGAVSNGGAVAISSENARCDIVDSIITENQALDFGGGVSNGGTVTVTGTRVYNNAATNGGADIATKVTGNTTLNDTIEQLNELFGADNLQVSGWACDYDFQENLYIPDVNPAQDNSLLKLSYSVKEPEPNDPTDPSEPTDPVDPTDPSDSENTGGDQDEEPGDTPTETPPSDDTGDNTNPTEPGGDAENTDNSTTTNDSNNVTNTDNSTTNNTTNTDNSSQVANTDNSNISTVTSGDTVTNNTTSTTADDHSDKSDHSSVTTDNSNRSVTTTDSSDRSTVYNYYTNQQKEQGQPGNVIVNVTPEVIASSGTSTQEQNTVVASSPEISIDAKGVDCSFEYTESGGYKISITASKDDSISDQAVAANIPAEEKENSRSIPWLDILELLLLCSVLICLIWNPKKQA